MSRIGWLEQALGFDRLAVWHRWTGFAAVWLLLAHAGLITWGYAAGGRRSVFGQLGAFVRHYPDVLMSIVGLALFLAVAIGSARAARRRLSRESWYGLHLYAYLAVALAFAHQLSVGTDFSGDRLARAWWIALYVAVAAAILGWRVGRPVVFNLRHRLRIQAVQREADGVVSIYLSGQRLDAIDAEAGQFFLWRFLAGWGWAKAHPFSLSAAPRPDLLRITVKDLGDDSHRILQARPGTRVFAEGPYGTFTAAEDSPRRVALIAGGIGITPLRALLDVLPTRHRGDVTLLYRVASDGEVAFRPELAAFQERRGVDVHVLVDPVIGDDRTDGLGMPALQRLVPDLAARDVYVCGPPGMVDAVRRRLKLLRVPADQIHFERFQY
jgi:predicted ferric reductase